MRYIMTIKIKFLRHGKTDWRMQDFANDGHQDLNVNAEGKEQIRETANKIIEDNISINCVFTSPLNRHLESANILKQELENHNFEIEITDALKDRYYGEWLQEKAQQVVHFYESRQYDHANQYINEHLPNDGETAKVFFTRLECWFKSFVSYIKLPEQEDGTLILSSGCTYREIYKIIRNGDMVEHGEGIRHGELRLMGEYSEEG